MEEQAGEAGPDQRLRSAAGWEEVGEDNDAEEDLPRDAARPWPWYTPADRPSVEHPLPCFWPNCEFAKGESFGQILEHARTFHKQPWASLKGSHLHTIGSAEVMAKQERRREKKTEAKQMAAKDTPKAASSRPAKKTKGAGKTTATASNTESAVHDGGKGTIEDQTLLTSAEREAEEKEGEKHEEPKQLVASRETVATTGQSSSSSSSSANPFEMLNTIFEFVQGKKEEDKWKERLPTVNVKSQYLEIEAPPAKGEGVDRADWPRSLQPDFVETPGFSDYMAEHQNKDQEKAKKAVLGVGRLLGFLNVTPNASKPDLQIESVEVLIALYTSGNHLNILRSPLLHPKYGWSPDVMAGLALYCRYHMRELTQSMSRGEKLHFKKYSSVLGSLLEDLNGGYRKRCAEMKQAATLRKQSADLKLMKQVNLAAMQAAVLKGYMVLAAIERQFKNRPLDRKTRGRANACLAGGIAFDTFSGRKMEWENLLYEYFMTVLEAHGDHFVCSEHKTAQTYGSIAKLLTQGLLQAFLCYSRLHRPEGCRTFLVPASPDALKVCLPSALRAWCSSHLGAAAPVWPTFNLVRKLFHRALMLLTEDKEKMKELMVVLDAHSKKVQGVHYILRDPADDVVLAKQLVKAVLGKTVVWPSDQQVEEYVKSGQAQEERTGYEGEADSEADSEDEELPYFKGAEMFGVSVEVLTPLLDLQQEVSAERQLVASSSAGQEDAPNVKKRKSAKPEKSDGDKKKKAPQPKKAAEKKKNGPEPKKDAGDDGAYDPDPAIQGLGKRMKVAQEAHAFMRQALQEWQSAEGKSASDKPYDNEWYHALRTRMIKADLITTDHSKDVCRSYLKSWLKKQPEATREEPPRE